MLAGDGIVTVVFAFGHSLVAGVLVALILGCKQRAELLDLRFHSQKMRNEQRVFLGTERIVGFSVLSAISAFECGAVVIHAAEQFEFVHCVISRATHNCAHLKSLSVVIRRMALSAYVVFSFENCVVGVSVLLEVYSRTKSRRTCADDTNLVVFSHDFLLFWLSRFFTFKRSV